MCLPSATREQRRHASFLSFLSIPLSLSLFLSLSLSQECTLPKDERDSHQSGHANHLPALTLLRSLHTFPVHRSNSVTSLSYTPILEWMWSPACAVSARFSSIVSKNPHVPKSDQLQSTLYKCYTYKGRFTLRWRRPPVGQECLAKTWLYEANGGCAGEELKAIKYFY
jgi:hypothetical protein